MVTTNILFLVNSFSLDLFNGEMSKKSKKFNAHCTIQVRIPKIHRFQYVNGEISWKRAERIISVSILWLIELVK